MLERLKNEKLEIENLKPEVPLQFFLTVQNLNWLT